MILFSKSITLKFFLLLSITLCSLSVSYAESVEQLFNKANNYYKVKKYIDAIATYNEILKQGNESYIVYYNLGNTYYKNGNFGYAILYFEKALKLSPGDEDIIHNIAIVSSKLKDKVEIVPKLFIFNWWEALISIFSPDAWTIVTSIFFIMILLAITLFFFSRTFILNRIAFFCGIIFIFLFFISFILTIGKIESAKGSNYGVLINNVANVKSSPDENGKVTFIIHEGLKVKIEDEIDNWYKIRLTDGKLGWIEKEDIGII